MHRPQPKNGFLLQSAANPSRLRPREKWSSTALKGRLRSIFPCVLAGRIFARLRYETIFELGPKNNRGNSIVDYLMITAVVAGIAIPIASKYFAGPLLDSFQSQRGRLVQFVAQTPRQRKPTVPTPWFSAERQANVNGGGTLSAPGDLPPPGEISLGDVKESGDISQQKISEGSGGKDSQLSQGDAGGAASIGQGGISGSGRGGGGGAGLDGSNSLSGDFFAKGKEDTAEGEGADGGANRGTYGRGGGSFEGENSEGGRAGATASEKKAQEGGEEKGKEEGGLSVEKKRQALANQAQEIERERAGQFDWWLLVKFLILALIIFLGVLIILSNLKKR